MPVDVVDLHFQGVPRPVRLVRCADLLEEARVFFLSWPFRESPPAAAAPFAVLHRGRDGRYRIDADACSPLVEETVAGALCGLSIILVTAFCAEPPDTLCLHAAALRFARGGVLLFGANGAGKSALAVRLTAAGHTGYGDDMVGLTPQGSLMSFGIPSRLRLPLPRSDALGDFVRRHKITGDARYQYLRADMPLLAPFGRTLPATRGLILRRAPDSRPRLIPVPPEDGLPRILHHCVILPGTAESVFRRAERLADAMPMFVFRYSDLDEAAEFLRARLAAPCSLSRESGLRIAEADRFQPLRSGDSREEPPKDPKKKRRLFHSTPLHIATRRNAARRCVRADAARGFERDSGLFLVNGDTDAVFRLNELGRAVWALLSEPLSEKEAVLLLRECFPAVPQGRIARDMARLFRDLRRARLIVPPAGGKGAP